MIDEKKIEEIFQPLDGCYDDNYVLHIVPANLSLLKDRVRTSIKEAQKEAVEGFADYLINKKATKDSLGSNQRFTGSPTYSVGTIQIIDGSKSFIQSLEDKKESSNLDKVTQLTTNI